MKKLLSLFFLILFFTVLSGYAQEDKGICEKSDKQLQQDVLQEEIQEQTSAEEKIMDEDTVYFDAENYKKKKAEGKVFKLKVEQNDELLKHSKNSEGINFSTKYTETEVGKEKFNNKTTISSKTMTNSKLFGNNLSFGYGASIKEYMPISDLTNYSLLSTSLYATYKFKRFALEGELEQSNNIITETIANRVSLGPKFNITKSTSIKTTVTKDFFDNTIFGEVSLVYRPIKSKRNFYIEFDALSTNTQYNIPQQRFQFFGKIKI